MIISPRAKPVTDILRKEGNGFIKIDEVFLMRRIGAGSPYRKILYWKRGAGTTGPPPSNLRSFAIVPEMTAAIHKGFGIHNPSSPPGTTWRPVWHAFNRTSSIATIDDKTWTVVSFPEARWVKSYSIAPYAVSVNGWLSSIGYTVTLEGKFQNGEWIPLDTKIIHEYGGHCIVTTPMLCTAVRFRCADYYTAAIKLVSCQFFDAVPLVFSGIRDTIVDNHMLFSALWNVPLQHGNDIQKWKRIYSTWYENNSNKGQPSTQDQTRFIIDFGSLKKVCGLSAVIYYSAGVKCLLIEGRKSDTDFWVTLDEIEFDLANPKTLYFDFPKVHTVSQLRITVQEASVSILYPDRFALPYYGNIYMPLMQVYGEDVPTLPYVLPPYVPEPPVLPSQNNVVIIEQDGETFAVPIPNNEN
jgi:hypothetical protein